MQDPDLIQLAAQVARGRRPEFTGDPMVERLFGITVALTAELAVTRERLDSLERVLSSRDPRVREEVEQFTPDVAAASARGALQQDYLARVFRVLLQDEGVAPAGIAAEAAVAGRDEPGGRRVA